MTKIRCRIMKRRLSWKKLGIMGGMSNVDLWASSVLVIYNKLHEQLPTCTLPGQGTGGLQINCGKVKQPIQQRLRVTLVFTVGYIIANQALIYLVGFGTERICRRAFKTLFAWRFIGLLLNSHLVTFELLVVKAICLHCTIVHISIIVDFAVIRYVLFHRKDARGLLNKARAPPFSNRSLFE